jgi:glutamate-1-semialdehyde 2,1-aminomutase
VTGYRSDFPGVSWRLGLEPDLVTWGKASGNGFAFCALTGRADIMDLGGIYQPSRPRVFLISTTHGGEAHGLAAARAVIREYRTKDVLGRHRQLAAAVTDGMRKAVTANRLDGVVEIHASPWRVVALCRDGEGRISTPLRTLLLQEMIARGVLFQGVFLPTFTHTDADVAHVVKAFDESCVIYRDAIDYGVEKFLVGPPTRPVFRKYNGCSQPCSSTPCPLEASCRE